MGGCCAVHLRAVVQRKEGRWWWRVHHACVPALSPGAGIYQHSFEAAQNARHGFPVYSVNIEANHIQVGAAAEAYYCVALAPPGRQTPCCGVMPLPGVQ